MSEKWRVVAGRTTPDRYTVELYHEDTDSWSPYHSIVSSEEMREISSYYLSFAESFRPVKFTDAWDCAHELTVEAAARELKEFYDEWPGGLEEMAACIRVLKRKASQGTLCPPSVPPARVVKEDDRPKGCK